MEIQNDFYIRVAQAAYSSYECYDGWTLDTTNGLCYILNPNGQLNYADAVACCSALGGQILGYQLLADAVGLLTLSSGIWTDVHYDTGIVDWVDINDNVAAISWNGGSPPVPPPTFNCALALADYIESDCTVVQDYVCQDSVPIVSSFDFHDQRGSSYFIASNPSDDFGPINTGKVDVFWTRTEGQVFDSLWDATPVANSFTLYGYQTAEGFGASVSYLQDHVIDHQLFIGAVASYQGPTGCTPATTLNNGKVYVYHGEYTKWTASQILLPPAQFNEQSFFGEEIDSDKALLHTLVVGCRGCNYTTNSGAIFVYQSTPTGSAWSENQILTPSSNYLNLAADRVRIHETLILGDAGENALVWKQLPHLNAAESLDESLQNEKISRELQALPPRWSQQQALKAFTYTLSSFDVFDDTIVLGATGTPVGVNTNVGAVHVLYPSSPEFGFHPKKPQPMQWSTHQILYPPTPLSNNLQFGKDVSIAADRMYILGGGALGYLYARPTRVGYWSLQQVITHGGTTIGALIEGSTVYSLVNSLTAALEVFDQTRNWFCLIVSIGDHFGDGWDTARLTVTTPEGPIKDEFHPTCDLPNPFQFRYCPSVPRVGIYSFSIPDAVKAKYHWEILWGVFLESTGEWISGSWDTRMDFDWDMTNGGFRTVHIHKPLPGNYSCTVCPVRPTLKPSPLRRNLKGSTRQPTISPAPTLPTVPGTIWQYLLVSGGTDDWFADSHKTTSYYISDVEGRRLISTGSLCPSDQATSKLCWEDVPDGEYVLRVGGALNSFSGTHTFKWCKATNAIPAQSQVVVRIAERDCQFLSYFSRDDFCGIALNYDIVIEFELYIMGVKGPISSAGTHVLAMALGSVFQGFVSSSIVAATPSNGGLHVVLQAKLNGVASGYDLTDPSVLTAVEIKMVQDFQQHERMIWTSMLSGEYKTELAHATGVTFLSLHFVGIDHEPISPELIADEVQTYYPPEETKVASAPLYLSMSGFLVLLLAVLLVSTMVAFRSRQRLEIGSVLENNPNHPMNEAEESLLPIKGKKSLSSSSSSSSKTTKTTTKTTKKKVSSPTATASKTATTTTPTTTPTTVKTIKIKKSKVSESKPGDISNVAISV